jgi:hypothetical protein
VVHRSGQQSVRRIVGVAGRLPVEVRARGQIPARVIGVALELPQRQCALHAPHSRKDSAAMWDIGEAPEVSDAELPKLLSECEVALEFTKPAEQSCMEDEPKESIWTLPFFQKEAR